MYVWTFTVFNHDLLIDDPVNEVTTMMPLVAWTDKEDARKAAQEDINGFYHTEDDEEPLEAYKLEWTSAERQFPEGSERGRNNLVEDEIVLYRIEVLDDKK